jgi:hypothetical protein
MESIESLSTVVEKFSGTVIFSRTAELKEDRTIVDYRGTYEEYLWGQGVV